MDTLCSSRACAPTGYENKGKLTMETEAERKIMQQLLDVSQCVHALRERFANGPQNEDEKAIGLEQKLNVAAVDSEQQLQKLKKDIFERLDSDALVVKAVLMKQVAVLDTQTESLRNVEQSISTLLGANMGARLQESKSIASNGVESLEPRVEGASSDLVLSQLGSLQTVLMTELTAQKEVIQAQQEQLLREITQMSAMPAFPPRSKDAGQIMSDAMIPATPTTATTWPQGVTPTPPNTETPNGIIPARFETLPKEELEKRPIANEQGEPSSKIQEEPSVMDEVEEVHDRDLVLQEGGSLGSVFSNELESTVPPYHVEDFYYKTGISQQIARSNFFANFTVIVVIINAVYIGFDSDYNEAANIYQADIVFQAFSQFFCVYFTWELLVRFLAFEHKCNAFKDGWFKFDTFLVSTMILDVWVLMLSLYLVPGDEGGEGVKIPTQPLRMLRLFKLTRMARLMKAFPELMTMIKGLVRSLRAISSSMILVGLMVYVFAIMMHMLMKEENEFNDFIWTEYQLGFRSMTTCIWTLLMAGTLMLDNASPVMSLLLFSDKFNYVLGGIAFLCYAMTSAMCILQMLIGVLCDVVSTVKSEENSANAIGLLRQEILKDLQDLDDGDGKITQVELFKVMNSPRSKRLLKRLRISRPFLHELQKMMYSKPGLSVPIQEVLDLMVMCRGDNVATVESMAGALVAIIEEIGNVKFVLERDLGALEARLHHQIGAFSQTKDCRGQTHASLGETPRSQAEADLQEFAGSAKPLETLRLQEQRSKWSSAAEEQQMVARKGDSEQPLPPSVFPNGGLDTRKDVQPMQFEPMKWRQVPWQPTGQLVAPGVSSTSIPLDSLRVDHASVEDESKFDPELPIGLGLTAGTSNRTDSYRLDAAEVNGKLSTV